MQAPLIGISMYMLPGEIGQSGIEGHPELDDEEEELDDELLLTEHSPLLTLLSDEFKQIGSELLLLGVQSFMSVVSLHLNAPELLHCDMLSTQTGMSEELIIPQRAKVKFLVEELKQIGSESLFIVVHNFKEPLGQLAVRFGSTHVAMLSKQYALFAKAVA